MTRCAKRTYPTWAKAAAVALHRSGEAGRPLRVYACPSCRGFHLTKRVQVAGR